MRRRAADTHTHWEKLTLKKHHHSIKYWQAHHNCHECAKISFVYFRAKNREHYRDPEKRADINERARQRVDRLQNRQMLKPDTAGRRGTRWADWELEIALCPDLTWDDKLELLERTYKAISEAIYRYRDPEEK